MAEPTIARAGVRGRRAAGDGPGARSRAAIPSCRWPGVDEAIEVAPPETAHEEVLVLDFGGQYSQLIARRIRECGVYAELLPHDLDARARSASARPAALVLSGGPASVYSPAAPKLRSELLELGIPVLGICYGMQAMVLELGGRVEGAEAGEFGRTELTLAGDGGRLLAGLPRRAAVLDEPPRLRLRAARRASPRSPPAPARRSPRSRTPSAASTGSSSTPRSSTRPTASRSSSASCARSPAARRTGRRPR